MDKKYMTLLILSSLLVTIGGLSVWYAKTQIGKDKSVQTKPKSDLLMENTNFLPTLRNFKDEWRKIVTYNLKKRDQIEAKYKNDTDSLQKKTDELRTKEVELHKIMLRKYQEKLKPEAKRIKYESEIFLNIYRKSETSYAEYDRIDGDYDLDKIINDLDFLKTKIQLKEE